MNRAALLHRHTFASQTQHLRPRFMRPWPAPLSSPASRRTLLLLGTAAAATAAAAAASLSLGARRGIASAKTTGTVMAAAAPAGPASLVAAGGGGSPQLPRAVNLRDLADAAPGLLRRGALYRCSQVFTPEVVRELRLRTVVDLRGRAERRRAQRHQHGDRSHHHSGGATAAGAAGDNVAATAAAFPPPPPEALTAEELAAFAAGGVVARAAAAGASGGGDLVALRRRAAADGNGGNGDAVSEAGSVATSSADERNGGGGADADAAATAAPAHRATAEELARVLGADGGNGVGGVHDIAISAPLPGAGAGGDAADAGATAAAGALATRVFDLIPTAEFARQLLRMPRRVWLDSLARALTLRDPRLPFVEALANEQLMGFTKYYATILEHAKPAIGAVLRVLGAPGATPALVHCAHGKDRTGVVVMLALAACGVSADAIVDDYVQSEAALRRFRDETLQLPPARFAGGGPIPLSDVVIASTESTMRALLAYLRAAYPAGVDAYLAACGLGASDRAALRAALMEPPALAALEARFCRGGEGEGGGVGECAVPWPEETAGGGVGVSEDDAARRARVAEAAAQAAAAATAAAGGKEDDEGGEGGGVARG